VALHPLPTIKASGELCGPDRKTTKEGSMSITIWLDNARAKH
jgi:hypothetical protein